MCDDDDGVDYDDEGEDEDDEEEEDGELGSTCIMWCVSSSILLRRPAMLEKSST